MKVSKAEKIWLDYHHIHSKKNTVRCYSAVVGKLCEKFGDQQFSELSVENVLGFLNQHTIRSKPQTKRIRYAHLSAFFNFIKTTSSLISSVHVIPIFCASCTDQK